MTHKASKELLRVENLHKQYGDNEVSKACRSPPMPVT
jgi:ABC-type histidine transport system ATPase subunit